MATTTKKSGRETVKANLVGKNDGRGKKPRKKKKTPPRIERIPDGNILTLEDLAYRVGCIAGSGMRAADSDEKMVRKKFKAPMKKECRERWGKGWEKPWGKEWEACYQSHYKRGKDEVREVVSELDALSTPPS
jgi:hypothetical protein